jgi:hypothetical protein
MEGKVCDIQVHVAFGVCDGYTCVDFLQELQGLVFTGNNRNKFEVGWC